jgi:hypothetical protein
VRREGQPKRIREKGNKTQQKPRNKTKQKSMKKRPNEGGNEER